MFSKPSQFVTTDLPDGVTTGGAGRCHAGAVLARFQSDHRGGADCTRRGGRRDQYRMLSYLDEACNWRRVADTLRTFDYLIETVHRGAVERIRLMAMIGMVDVVGLLSVMCASGTNADVMKRLAAPQIGGVFSAMLLTLFVIPVVYMIWRWYRDIKFLAGKSAV